MFLTADSTAILVADRRAARELAAARRRSLRVERRAVAATPARIPAPAPAVAICHAA